MKQPEINRLLAAAVKQESKKRGWRSVGSQPYWQDGPLFYDMLIMAAKRPPIFHYSLRVKWFTFDDRLWAILGIPENSEAPRSLRANGAFALQGQSLLSARIPDCDYSEPWLTSQVQLAAASAAAKAAEVSTSATTLGTYMDVIERYYAILLAEHPRAVLNLWKERLLAALEMGDRSGALAIARQRIEAGDTGGFISEGKTFFERASEYLTADA